MTRIDDAAARSPFLSLEGRGAAPGLACGKLARTRSSQTASDLTGRVWVAERAVPEDVPRILAAAGTLTFGGAMLSHVTLLSRELGRPSVALRPDLRARLLPEGDGTGLIELRAVVGGGRPVLHEGDVVFLDGDSGTVRVPGGLDRACQGRVGEVWDAIASWAVSGDPATLSGLVEMVATRVDPLLDFALEVALAHARVASGAPARALVRGLTDRLGAEPVGARILALHARCRARTEAVLARLSIAIDEAVGADELDGFEARIEEARSRWSALSADLGDREPAIEPGFAEAVRAVDRRRSALRSEVLAAVDLASRESDAALRPRTGQARRLVRRARALGVDAAPVAHLQTRIDRLVGSERERAGGRIVIPLRAEEGAADRASVGGKAAGLLRSMAALPPGASVPPGFVVTTAAYRTHLAGEVGERLREALEGGLDADEIARRARAAILAWDVPPDVVRALSSAVETLAGRPLAVRSSADVEDDPDGSLAGQFDSWLGVRGRAAVVDRLRWCWASLWNVRALRAMAASGRSPLAAAQAVLVQEVVETRAAGVLATRDPSGRSGAGLVNATWGLGEAVSQGTAPGDLYWFRRSDGSLIDREISTWDRRIVLSPGGAGTAEDPLPRRLVGRPCLDDRDLGRLSELARALEAAFCEPLDVEFGFDGADGLHVFQVRPLARPRGR